MNAPVDQIESGPTQAVYLTAAQVADLLQVSPKTIYRLAKADASLPTLEIGGVVRFPRERLLRWLRNREQGQSRRSPDRTSDAPCRTPA